MSDSESEHTASSPPPDHVAHRAHEAKGLSRPKAEPAEVCRVALRLPPFWPERLDRARYLVRADRGAIWECWGDNRRHKIQLRRGHLDPQFSKEVKDVIMSPPAANRYEKLKTATDSATYKVW